MQELRWQGFLELEIEAGSTSPHGSGFPTIWRKPGTATEFGYSAAGSVSSMRYIHQLPRLEVTLALNTSLQSTQSKCLLVTEIACSARNYGNMC